MIGLLERTTKEERLQADDALVQLNREQDMLPCTFIRSKQGAIETSFINLDLENQNETELSNILASVKQIINLSGDFNETAESRLKVGVNIR